MRIRIDLLPREEYIGETVVLVDVLRCCTVAPLLFDNGVQRLVVTSSLREARAAANRGRLLLGERGGVPPEGFNQGASPTSLRTFDVSGREAVLLADNAPRALSRVDGAERVLLASLFNAGSVARAVHDAGATRVSVVCCGFGGQEDIDDALSAGFIGGEIARRGHDVRLEGGARLSMGLLLAFPDPLEALWHSTAGRELRRKDMAEDIGFASGISLSDSVPLLTETEAGRHAQLFHFIAAG